MNRKNMVPCLFLLPGLTGVTILIGLPTLDVFRRSFFTSMTGEFVGLSNYWNIFHNQAFCLAVSNTVRFMLVCIPILAAFSLMLALFLSNRQHNVLLKSVFLFPMAVPTASLVILWKIAFHGAGMLNGVLSRLHIPCHIDWMNTSYSFYILVGSYIWKNIGYTLVLWSAGILEISDSILEAAKMDGANRLQQIRHIILPNLKGTAMVVFLMCFINAFRSFREAYLVAGAYPNESIYMMQHLVNNWFVNLEMDKIAAAAVLMALFLMAATIMIYSLMYWKRDN